MGHSKEGNSSHVVADFVVLITVVGIDQSLYLMSFGIVSAHAMGYKNRRSLKPPKHLKSGKHTHTSP